MAEDIVGGLFGVNPAMYQQQQQQQVFNRAVAMQNLDPFQQAAVGVQQAGYNLAGALGGAMGGVDPQLQRISTLNAISKQIDQSNPESMMSGAKMLADAGFTQEALGLANYARKANSELALAQQRMKEGRAAAIPKEVQIAEYSANIKNQLGQLQGMEQTPEVVNAIALLQNRLDALPQPKEGSQNADIVKAQRAAQIVNQLAVLNGLPEGQQNPDAIRALETELAILNPTKETSKNAKIAEAQRAGQIVNQLATIRGLPEAQQSEDAIRALEAELAVLNPSKAEKENPQIAQGLRIGELTSQIDVLESLPEAQQNKPLIKRLNAELSFLVGATKAEARTSEVKNAREYADSLGFVSGSKEWQTAYATKFAELIAKPEKADRAPPSVGAEAERISQTRYGKRFSQLSQAEAAIVDAEVEERDLAGKKAAAIKVENILPGTEKLVDIPAFRSSVQRTIEPQLKIIDATDTALAAIDDSIATNNFSSFRAAQTQFARAISGGGDLSQKELLAAGADPAILGGTADYLSKLVSGTPTLDTQNKIKKTLLAIRKVSLDKAQGEIKQQRNIANLQKYPQAALDAALNFPQLQPYQGATKASKTLTTKSGKKVIVTEE
jgi:hypothetical protein